MLVCGHLLFTAHLFLNEMAVFATRDGVVKFDWIVQGAVLVFNVCPKHWAVQMFVEAFEQQEFTLSWTVQNKLL